MRILFTALLLSGAACSCEAAECDGSLQPITAPSDIAYRDRGDRCEGVYQQPVAMTGLRIVGFLSAPSSFQENDHESYVVTRLPGVKRLTVESLRRRQYYRMDAVFTTDRFRYPLQIVRRAELAIRPDELTARVCVDACDGVLPVLAAARIGDVASPEKPFVVLRATQDLIYLRIEIMGRDGSVLLDRDVLASTVWQAWRPIEIPVQDYLAEQPIVLRAAARGRFDDQIDAVAAVLKTSE